jgi:hypothetical protein
LRRSSLMNLEVCWWDIVLINSKRLLRAINELRWLWALGWLHSTLSSWTSSFSFSRLGLWLNKSSSFKWGISSQIHGAISACSFVLNYWVALVCNEISIGPVTSSKLREDKHTFVTDFKGSSSWNLLEIRATFIIILYQVVV